jgi:hypothetical protein
MALYVVVHRIYEPQGPLGLRFPVVEHRFFGKTPEAAQAIYQAHRKTDAFLAACDDTGHWRDVRCTSRVTLQRIA